MGLFDKIFSKKYDPSASLSDRRDAVRKLKDQDKLVEIVKTDGSYLVRIEAVRNIDNQDVLIDVAINDSDWSVRLRAVEKINDADVLADIAKNEENFQVYTPAIEKIDDEYILADIAKNAKDGLACEKAASKISSESILMDILKNSNTRAIYEIIKKTDNQDVLIDLALNHSSELVRRDAASRISDESVLEDIVKNTDDKFARKEVVKKITDTSVLRDVALNDDDVYVRIEATKRITDDSVLWEIILNDSESNVQKVAYEKTIKYNNFNDFISNSSDFYNEELLEFERLNHSTYSIYDLGDFEVLIIDSEGNNYTSWNDYKPMMYRKKKYIKNQIERDERNNPWASGHDDVSFSDDILFISENFKNKSHLPKYEIRCEEVGYGIFLNPTTDRATEKGIYSLCHFKSLKALVISDLSISNISHDHFDKCNAKTIFFNRCNIDNARGINFKNCENLFGLY